MRFTFDVRCLLLILAIALVPVALLLRSGASVSASIVTSSPRGSARMGDQPTVHSAGRGAPIMKLTDGRELLTAYAGNVTAQRALEQNLAQPLSISSADFDEDGVPDLVTGYAAAGGGVITLHRGNVDSIFPNAPEARQRKATGSFTDAPFLSPALAMETPAPTDFIGCGDFDADGHLDVVTAARGSAALYFFLGDGRGNLSRANQHELPGRVTAMIIGEINHGAGRSDIAIGISEGDGRASILMLGGPEGALRATPEAFPLPADATALALGKFDDDLTMDLAVACGHELMIVRGPAITRSLTGASRRTKDSLDRRAFASEIRSLAVGNFTGHHRDDLAILGEDGRIHLLSRSDARSPVKAQKSARRERWLDEDLPGYWPQARLLARAHVSSLPTDNLVVIESNAHRLELVVKESASGGESTLSTISESLEVDGEPIAVLPMRLNSDALSDMVILTSGRTAPTVTLTSPSVIFLVTNTNDTGVGSLRAAIDQANTTLGADFINFASGLGTINVGAVTGLPLPAITEAVTIDGGAARVELNGALAASLSGDGLDIFASGTSVRGLVINRFIGNGILLQSSANLVERNFIGTNAAGNAALPNLGDGVLVVGPNNTIGGTAVASRNVISGNTRFGVTLNTIQASFNFVRGNFIGTNSSGTAAVGNVAGGVRTLGGAMGNSIGGTSAGAANTIAFNSGSGVNIFAGVSNAVLTNSIFSNGVLGIDISDDASVTPNDACDADLGANNLQNFPVLTTATSGGGTTMIVGTLNSTTSTVYRIEFFSSSNCSASGNGEGRTFIGATSATIGAALCDTGFNATFPVSVAPGQVITATATDPSNNTSEFSPCVTVTPAVCTVTCPPDLKVFTALTSISCGTVVTFSPTTVGSCGTVSCAPPSGSIFSVGSTTVTCTAVGFPSCSFIITVVDATPPSISCPANIITNTPPGQASAVVNYPPPSARDNCAGVSVQCTPPSGSRFPVGGTIVNCVATDESTNQSKCLFSVTVFDLEPPTIVCPPAVTVVTAVGQTSAVVTYPPPTVTDNRPGATAVCAPPSGATLPLGITTVTCTATDAGGIKSICSFQVKVGGPQAKLTIPTGKPSIEFATSPRRKPPKPKNNPCGSFTIENVGFAPLVLTLDSILRTGADVDSKRVSDPNDTRYFTVSVVNPDQTLTALAIGGAATIQPGQVQGFCVNFAALIPGLAGKTTGLAASDVLPDTLTSSVTFRQNAGANITVPISGRVSTELNFVNPANPRTPPVVTFARSGNEFIVSYALFDSNLDITRAKYEFINGGGQVLASFDIDLAGPIRSLNLIKAQSFSVEQRFTGANDNPEVTGVRLTVFDGETSVVSSAGAITAGDAGIQSIDRKRSVTLRLPDVMMGPNQ